MIPIAIRRQQMIYAKIWCSRSAVDHLKRSTIKNFTPRAKDLWRRYCQTTPKTMVAVDLGFPKRSRRVGDRSKVLKLATSYSDHLGRQSNNSQMMDMCEKYELFLERFLQSFYTSQLPYPAKFLRVRK